tara:strand:+ start:1690 stop:2118 length:429 start_codon:yes stop_codon:yes gene_type:complete
MLGLIKSLPYMLVIGALAFGAHKFIVGNLNDTIDKQAMQIEQYVAQNVALQTAAQQNENTIRSLEAGMLRQIELTQDLTLRFNEAQKQKDEALRIFNEHDITKLARNKPGLMEPRANRATKLEFEGIEELSRETAELNEQDN